MTEKIGIIGRMADGAQLYDGQTVLTRLLRDELEKKSDGPVYCVDTYRYKQRCVMTFLRTIICLFRCKHIFVLLSRNGRRFYFPFLYYANKLFKRRIYHRVIGGTLDVGIREYPGWVRYLNSFVVNWTEGHGQKVRAQELGVNNAVETVNFKPARIIGADEFPDYQQPPYRFCTFCRVTKPKGIDEAIKAIIRINEQRGAVAQLDVYGPMDEEFRAEFETLVEQAGGAVRYMGSVPYDKCTETLKDYFVHLFPTTWRGEGMPGTLVDAFAAGLPTIATDWNMNTEVLTQDITGICYDWQQPEQLEQWMLWAIDHPEKIAAMRPNCTAEAVKYTPEVAMQQVWAAMEG